MNQNKLALLAFPLLLAGLGNDISDIRNPIQRKVCKDWERKKCKSCKYYSCKAYQTPLDKACEKYEKRKRKK